MNTEKGTILVTGSSGQLGSAIVQLLRKRNYKVIGIDILAGNSTDEILDIRNYELLKKRTLTINAIIHTAALHGKHYYRDTPRERFIETNITGTHNLLKAAVCNGVKKFIYTSSTSVYGNAMLNEQQAVWVDENLHPEPRDIYDITKLTCEMLCKDYFEKEGLETNVLRVSRFLPEDENTKVNHRIYRGVDVNDGAMAHLLALEKDFDAFEIYNISNDTPFQKQDLKTLYINPEKVICKYYPDAKRIFEEKGWKFLETIDRVYSIEKAKAQLNYRPINNFDNFLKL